MSLINTQVQPFKAQAFHNGKFIEVTEQSLQGKWSVLIFMPAAFTFNCPTEIEDAAEHYAEFQEGRCRSLHRHHRHALLAQSVARNFASSGQGSVPAGG
jgi:alkyl hydroperoxide reductase subunit AhpC